MLQDNSSNNYLNNEKEINEEIITSSEQRIQTYTLLLNCISKKFKEIEDLLDKDEEKISELHSNIEFSNNLNNIFYNCNNIFYINVYKLLVILFKRTWNNPKKFPKIFNNKKRRRKNKKYIKSKWSNII